MSGQSSAVSQGGPNVERTRMATEGASRGREWESGTPSLLRVSARLLLVKQQREGQKLTLPEPLLLAEQYAEDFTSLQSFYPGCL